MTEPPLVLFGHDADPETVERAAKVLRGVARVMALPPDAAGRQAALGGAEAILVGKWHVPRDEEPLLRRLRFVQRVWAGAETLPFQRLLAIRPDVRFAGNPGPNAPQVAEHAVALYLDCAKRVTERDAALRRGEWTQETRSQLVAGSRVAVAGWGEVGRRVGRTLVALGADVVAVTRDGTAPDTHVRAASLDGLRAMRGDLDGLVLALPLTDTTVGLVDHGFLAGMRSDAILVNIARGRLIVERDLFEHLRTHEAFRAGLDVWWHYPDDGGPFEQLFPFGTLPNVVMTPHCAFHVPGTRGDMVEAAAQNVALFLRGGLVRGLLDPAEHARLGGK